VQYIEAHATSTELGDATEVQSLTDALGETLTHKIPIASVKANIGHTLETAGIAGLIKTVLAMQYGIIPCAANLHTLTSSVDWDRVPFFVPEQTLSWPPSGEDYVRRAGVNSFGVGGINVHVVVDQAHGSPAMAHAPATAPAKRTTREPLAIIGASCLLPGAENLESLKRLLESGADATQLVPPTRRMGTVDGAPSPDAQRRGGFLAGYEFDWKTFRIAPKLLAAANPLQFMMLDVASRALADAGYSDSAVDRTRVATIVGTIFHGDYQIEHWYGVWMWDFVKRLSQALEHSGASTEFIEYVTQSFVETLQARKPAARDETASAAYSTLASRIAKHFDLMGGAFTVDAADASAMAALSWAYDQLNAHNCDMVICAAGQRSMDLTYCDDYVSRGHQVSQNDVTLGEGAMCVILKRLSDACRDGSRIHGILHSSTFASGATLEEAIAQAMRETRARSNVANSNGCDETVNFSFCESANSALNPQCLPFGDMLGANGLLLLMRGLLRLEHGLPSELTQTKQEGSGAPTTSTTLVGKCVTSLRLATNRGMLSPNAGTAGEIVLERCPRG
jgi:acyl transferase domain-containing protein